MSNYIKLLGIILVGLLLTNCSSGNYKIKSEKNQVLDHVPKWYVSNFSGKKACGTTTFGKNKEKVCVFGVGTAVSPDLQLAIEKGMIIAKAEIADVIKGEMNKKTSHFVTELGKTQTKQVVSEVELTIVNIISKTPVRGYEIFEKDITMTKNGYYRVWIGLKLPMGEFNKMYHYAVETALDAHNLKERAQNAYKELVGDSDKNNNIQ